MAESKYNELKAVLEKLEATIRETADRIEAKMAEQQEAA